TGDDLKPPDATPTPGPATGGDRESPVSPPSPIPDVSGALGPPVFTTSAPLPPPVAPALPANRVVGEARGIQQRAEGDKQVPYVWTCRVERYDRDGNRLPAVPVEMRGYSFEG